MSRLLVVEVLDRKTGATTRSKAVEPGGVTALVEAASPKWCNRWLRSGAECHRWGPKVVSLGGVKVPRFIGSIEAVTEDDERATEPEAELVAAGSMKFTVERPGRGGVWHV